MPSRHDPQKDTERMIRMWQKDLRISQEHLWPEGHHIFHCDIHVFRAVRNFAMDAMAQRGELPSELQRVHEINCRTINSGPKSSACWSWQSYADWSKWTTERCTVHDIDADHVTVKLHSATMRIMVETLSAFVE